MVEPSVFVVDDDSVALDSVSWLVRSAGLRVEAFKSASEFLDAVKVDRPGCLLLDIRMPEMDGLDLQQKLAERGSSLPVIIITGYGNVSQVTRAFIQGAVGFLEKPVQDKVLIGLIRKAMERDAASWRRQAERAEIESRIARLTDRERQVMQLVIEGQTAKQIANNLHISFQTVAKHKSSIFKKMLVETDVELVRLALPLQSQPS